MLIFVFGFGLFLIRFSQGFCTNRLQSCRIGFQVSKQLFAFLDCVVGGVLSSAKFSTSGTGYTGWPARRPARTVGQLGSRACSRQPMGLSGRAVKARRITPCIDSCIDCGPDAVLASAPGPRVLDAFPLVVSTCVCSCHSPKSGNFAWNSRATGLLADGTPWTRATKPQFAPALHLRFLPLPRTAPRLRTFSRWRDSAPERQPLPASCAAMLGSNAPLAAR